MEIFDASDEDAAFTVPFIEAVLPVTSDCKASEPEVSDPSVRLRVA